MAHSQLRTSSGRTLQMQTGLHNHSNSTEASGDYLFVRPNGVRWQVAYVGQAESFRKRFCAHHKWAFAQQVGATEIHAAVVQDATERGGLEHEIYCDLMPPLNEVSPPAPNALLALIGRHTPPYAGISLGFAVSAYERWTQPGMALQGLGMIGARGFQPTR